MLLLSEWLTCGLSGLWQEVNPVPPCLGCVPWILSSHCWGHRRRLWHMLLAHMLLCNLNILQLTEHKALHQMCLNFSSLELKRLRTMGDETGNAVDFLKSFSVFGLDHFCTDIQHIVSFSDSWACQRTPARGASSWRHVCYRNVWICLYASVGLNVASFYIDTKVVKEFNGIL